MAEIAAPSSVSPDAALARMRRIATGVLVALAGGFVASHFIGDGTGAMLIRSMAEAGLVGGLADWFAVEALFRHPLGLPIPHTALLPKNQATAARSVGRFFETHFLGPREIAERLREVAPSRHIAAWLTSPKNASLVAREITSLVAAILQHEVSPRLLVRLRGWLRAQALNEAVAPDAVLAAGLAALVKDALHGDLAGAVLDLVRDAIDRDRDLAVTLVQSQSRWWIASAVDRRIADRAVDGVLAMLDDLRSPESDLRRGFKTAADQVIDRLAADGALARAVGDCRRRLFGRGRYDALMLGLGTHLRDQLRAGIAENPDALTPPIAALIADLAARLQADPALQQALDVRIAEVASRLIGDMRPAISGYITDVIAGWEPAELIDRFEAEVGSDLQYIRINGAVLGALIGGALYGTSLILG